MLNRVKKFLLQFYLIRATLYRCREMRLKMFVSRVQEKHKTDWIFLVIHAIGDMVAFCSLLAEFKRRHGGRCILILRDAQRAKLAKSFNGVDDVVVYPFKKSFELAMKSTLLSKSIVRGRVMAPVVQMDLDAPMRKCPGNSFLDEFKYALGLQDYKGLIPAVNNEQCLSGNKQIYIVPDANTMTLPVDKSFWMVLADRLKQMGYLPVFNAKNGEYGEHRCECIALSEIPASAPSYAAIIGARCGLLDLFAYGHPQCLIAIYPHRILHPVFGRTHLEYVHQTNPNSWDPQKTDDENFRAHFSMKKMFEDASFINEIVIDKGSLENMNTILKFLKC